MGAEGKARRAQRARRQAAQAVDFAPAALRTFAALEPDERPVATRGGIDSVTAARVERGARLSRYASDARKADLRALDVRDTIGSGIVASAPTCATQGEVLDRADARHIAGARSLDFSRGGKLKLTPAARERSALAYAELALRDAGANVLWMEAIQADDPESDLARARATRAGELADLGHAARPGHSATGLHAELAEMASDLTVETAEWIAFRDAITTLEAESAAVFARAEKRALDATPEGQAWRAQSQRAQAIPTHGVVKRTAVDPRTHAAAVAHRPDHPADRSAQDEADRAKFRAFDPEVNARRVKAADTAHDWIEPSTLDRALAAAPPMASSIVPVPRRKR